MLELLVVMVVIGMLMAILLPAFHDMREKARAKEASSVSSAYENAREAVHVEYGYYPGEEITPPKILSQGEVITNYLRGDAGSANPKGIAFWE